MRRVSFVLAALLGATAVTVAPLTAPVASAQARIVSVVVEGTGNGHGRGLSQYGAYGRAIAGQDYRGILNAYFGGTIPGDPEPSTRRIDVRLLALDNVADLKVISATGAITVTGLPETVPGVPDTWGSVYAVEESPGTFRLWGLKTATDCNADTTGFADLGVLTSSVEFTTVGGDDVNTPAANVLGVCRPNGSVVHYRGTIKFWDMYAGNRVVNSVLVEQYLRGVIPREVPAGWGSAPNGMEALKAQAVAARSYALAQNRVDGYFVESLRASTRYASTCDSSTCQVYGGAATRATGSSLGTNVLEHPNTNAAVAATAGEVRRRSQSGPLVSTEYSSSNGPRTAGGTFPVIDDPWDATPSNRLHRWTRTLDAAALAARYGLGTLTSVTMDEAASAANRLYDGIWYNDVVLTGTGGTKRVPAWTFRGDNGLPSPGFTLRTETGPGGPMAANQRIELQVVGAAVTAPDGSTDVVPDGVSAVALNITAVLPSAAGFMTVWPCDVGRPDASNLNYVANGVVANSVIAPVGANGKVCFYTNQTSHLLVDISGWFSDSSFVGATPKRVIDTRNAIGGPKVRIAAGGTISVPLAGAAVQRTNGSPDVIPADATAVAMNVTAVLPSQAGFFTVWPCGTAMPTTSNLNFTTGSVVANGVVATLGASGSVCIYSDQQSDVLVDVLGWFGTGAGQPPYTGAVPSRIVDTRNAIGGPSGVITRGAPKVVPVRGVNVNVNGAVQQVPADASAVALNVTIVEAREAGYATVWPCGTPMPDASNVNFARGGTAANGVIAPIGSDGSVCIFTYSDAHLIVDIAGWFTGGATPAFRGNVPKRLVDTRNAIGPLPQ
jgi:peptidoglycan hydrolase-like amidase